MRDRGHRRSVHATKAVAAVTLALALFAGAALPAWAADSMTLTFVRHAQSEGNASGDTTDDDPDLTALGHQQAEAIAQVLKNGNAVGAYDGIFASSLVRTQQTARPIAAQILGKASDAVTIGNGPDNDVVVVPGIREINQGSLGGLPERAAGLVYLIAGIQWVFGNRYARIPGSEDGNEFDARMDEGLQEIYDSGDRNALAVSHAAAMMFWVMMNVDNPNPLLIVTNPLDNTSLVVITGNPEDGWHLQNWNGVEQSAEPSLPSKLIVDTRTFVIKSADSINAIVGSIASGNLPAIANSVRDGAISIATAAVEFGSAVVRDVVDEVHGRLGIPTPAASAMTGKSNTAKALTDTPTPAPKKTAGSSGKRDRSGPDKTGSHTGRKAPDAKGNGGTARTKRAA